MKKLLKSLAFRTIMPVLAMTLVTGVILYGVFLRLASDFADRQIEEYMREMSHDIYDICDENLSDLFRKGAVSDEKAVRIQRGLTIGAVENFMKKNDVQGSIIEEGGREILRTDNFPQGLSGIIEDRIKEHDVSSLKYEGRRYFVNVSSFEPWKWRIVLAKDSAAYSALLYKVNVASGIAGFLLVSGTLLLIYYLHRVVRHPLNRIIEPMKRDAYPEYKGIYEFEFLSDHIRRMMESLQQETRMLNSIYHIAASKKGEEFIDEVVLAVSRLFNLNSLVARIHPSGEAVRVVSFCLNGEITRGFDLHLSGTPLENVVSRKHLAVIEKDAYEMFPMAEGLAGTKADSYIGFAIFGRRNDVIGIVNAFGKQREFSERDIKVLQTIGQIVAAEFERIDEEQERIKIQGQLFHAQKMEAVGNLAGGIAHDFNNMLQGILGYASLLKIKVPKSDPLYKPLQVIEHSAERAAELTKELLGFARKGKYVPEPICLNDIVGDVIKIITRTFDKAIEITTRLEHDLWTVLADRNQIEHSILNLCLNARDAMPEGGTLHIETLNEAMDAGELPYPWMKAGRYAVVKVMDTGKGMDEEVRKHIFEPFFTTKEKGKGTGMGLAMTYGVVKSHDGFITADSEVGGGSLFTIYLPTVDMKPVRETAEMKELPRGKGTILVVDDEEVIRNLARDVLQELGYEVLEASDGQEAVDLYTSKKGSSIDLVILDLVMPKMGGAEAFQKLKNANPRVRVLVSSGFEVEEKTGEMINDKSIVGFVQKPYNMKEIAEVIRSALSSA